MKAMVNSLLMFDQTRKNRRTALGLRPPVGICIILAAVIGSCPANDQAQPVDGLQRVPDEIFLDDLEPLLDWRQAHLPLLVKAKDDTVILMMVCFQHKAIETICVVETESRS